jgi:long-chain acyl-CoA synthetase
MQDYAAPARYTLPPGATVTDDVFDYAIKWPDHVAFNRRVNGEWAPVTSREFAEQVERLAAGLIAAGIRTGDRIGLMANTSYEWMLTDLAILAAGAVTVTIYATSSADQVAWYLGDSGAVAVFVESQAHRDTVGQVADDLPALRDVWWLDGLAELADGGAEVTAEQVQQRRHSVNAESLATIVYTSGTTGRPKGCALTHGNMVAQVANTALGDGVLEKLFNEHKSTLLFLPLAHIYARITQMAAIHDRALLAHTSDLAHLTDELASFSPTAIVAVPRIFEKVYNTARHQAELLGALSFFEAAELAAIRYSEALENGEPDPETTAERDKYDELIYGKLRAALGGRLEYAISGAAPLGARLGHFFRGAGVNVLEGYGLSETAAGCTLNLPDLQKVGTVGRPIPACTVRIDPDGEVLMKGPHVFSGYWNNTEATAEVIDADGWFHTGDIGQLDDGYLRITGRKKDLIVTASGKNVAPAALEDQMRANWLVSECVVIGDRRPYVAALITLDIESLTVWKKEHGKPEQSGPAELSEDPELIKALQEAVDTTNATVSRAEAIRRFRVLAEEFSELGGELTATLKVRRDVVLNRWRHVIDALYS